MTVNKPFDHNARQEKYPNTQTFDLQRPARRAGGQILSVQNARDNQNISFLHMSFHYEVESNQSRKMTM